MRPNIYLIAQKAGVSTATVSRVLNNKDIVAPQTREKVISVMRELDYLPSSLARGLASSKASMVGILTINVETAHYAKTVDALSQELFKIGYSAVLCSTGGSIENNLKHLRMLISLGSSAIFSIGSVFRDTLSDHSVLSEYADIPFIVNNCILNAENSYSIVIDESYALKLCIEHLAGKGRRQIAYVKDADSYSGRSKRDAFLACTHEMGLPTNRELVCETERSIAGGAQAVDTLLQTGSPISAIIFGDDITAVGGMKRLQARGFRIPEDVAVIGFNNSCASSCCTPSMTTVNTKIDSIAHLMVSTFQQVIGEADPSHLLMVTPELIVREST